MVVVVGLILEWVTMVEFMGFFFSPVMVAGSGWLLGS